MKQKDRLSTLDVIEGEVVSVGGAAVKPSHAIVKAHSRTRSRSVAPVVSITPEQAQAIIDAAESQRDRLLLTVLWQTGCRINEALALRGQDIEADSLWLINLKHGEGAWKQVPLPAGSTLTAELALYQKGQRIGDDVPLFRSRQSERLSAAQAWRIVKAASARAGVQVRALRESKDGKVGDKVSAWPHVFRHSRAIQTLRYTDPVTAQQVLGHSNLQTTSRYLKYNQDELKRRVNQVPA